MRSHIRLEAAILLGLPILLSCSNPFGSAEAPPVIRHLGVEYGPYDPLTGMAGAFDFHDLDQVAPLTRKKLLEFGGAFAWGPCPPDCGISRHFIYRLPPGTPVHSPIDGYVIGIGYDDQWRDYEIVLGSRRNRSFWFIVVDHVLDVRVERGQRVVAGQWIANVGNGALEIDLSSDDNRTHCMLSYFDPTTVDLWRQRVTDHMRDWEAYVGDTSLYDQAAMVEPGCLIREMA